VTLFKFCIKKKCALHSALDGAFCFATEREYKCDNIIIIDFVNDNLESANKSFSFVITCSWSTISCKWLGIHKVMCIAVNSVVLLKSKRNKQTQNKPNIYLLFVVMFIRSVIV
jgi:hypothetical protein